MKKTNVCEYIKGWFVGNFDPSLIKTNDVEVAYKCYKRGDSEKPHYHKIATEITVIVEGEVRMNGEVYSSGDIVTIAPGEVTDFFCITDTKSIVVKHPGASNDKYEVDYDTNSPQG